MFSSKKTEPHTINQRICAAVNDLRNTELLIASAKEAQARPLGRSWLMVRFHGADSGMKYLWREHRHQFDHLYSLLTERGDLKLEDSHTLYRREYEPHQ